MANLKSAKKMVRKIKKRTARNSKKRRELRSIIKEVRELSEAGKKAEAEKKFIVATKKIDKAAKVNLIHRNTAARYKSRLAKRVNTSETKKATKKSK
jgi:small subunit ribosomal protein S20